MKVLGIDNVFFDVANLDEGMAHYQKLGLKLRFAMPQPRVAIFAVGAEEPGLILREKPDIETSKKPCFVWLEVADAAAFKSELSATGVASLGDVFATGTGYTVEVSDLWGNTLGFADYLKRPEMARKPT